MILAPAPSAPLAATARALAATPTPAAMPPAPPVRLTGTVTLYHDGQYGFVKDGTGRSIFFHASDQRDPSQRPTIGQTASFDLVPIGWSDNTFIGRDVVFHSGPADAKAAVSQLQG